MMMLFAFVWIAQLNEEPVLPKFQTILMQSLTLGPLIIVLTLELPFYSGVCLYVVLCVHQANSNSIPSTN